VIGTVAAIIPVRVSVWARWLERAAGVLGYLLRRAMTVAWVKVKHDALLGANETLRAVRARTDVG